MANGHYCKIYHVLAEEYPDVYEDDRTLGCYVRLLMVADAAWPLRPYLPAGLSRKSLDVLVEVGLIVTTRSHYAVRGLDKERSARSNAASNAARMRWGNADGNAEVMPPKAKQSRT